MSPSAATSRRGTKRKRPSAAKENIQTVLTRKLHHDAREVKKTAKKAKMFETKKVIKKLKSASPGKADTSDSEVKMLESMLEALKILDHEVVATTALKTKLNKDKALSSNEFVRAAIASELPTTDLDPAAPGSPEAKMQARILSSKLLSTEISAVIEGIHGILKLDSTPGGISREDADISSTTQPMKRLKPSSSTISVGKKSVTFSSRSGSGSDSDSGSHHAEMSGWESGMVGDDEKEADQGWESGSIGGPDEQGDDSAEEDSDGDEPFAKTSGQSKFTATESLFLPSLSVGFVRGSEEESDLSESELKEGDITPKKNRRGQRARRLIWGKKYGANANHKVKAREAEQRRREKQRKRPTAPKFLSSRPAPGVFKPQPSDSGWKKRPKEPSSSSSTLHPSWEAKKRLRQTQPAAIAPNVAKKIVFD